MAFQSEKKPPASGKRAFSRQVLLAFTGQLGLLRAA